MSNHKAFYGIDEAYFEKSNAIHTSAEIAQQPLLWERLRIMLLEAKNRISSFMDNINSIKSMRIIFTGAGSSAFIGDALSVLIAKSAGVRTESIHSTDLVSAPKSYLFADIPTLLVSFARSGNSPESVGAVKHARATINDLYEIAILCNDASDLYKITAESDKSMVLLMPEGSNDKGFAMTSSVSCMLLAGFALFNYKMIDIFAGDIATLSGDVSHLGARFSKAAQKWADIDFDRIVYLGCGFIKHLAHEASLKMMELTNGIVNGSYESATGFRHGPKSVLNDSALSIHMISSDPFTAKYDIDLLMEVCSQKKENKVMALCGKNRGDIINAGVGDEIMAINANGYQFGGEICEGIQMLVFCQILAMFKSISLGICTDNPSPNGEMNRVVKGVKIYY